MCYPQWLDAGTREGCSQTRPLTPGRWCPPCSDLVAASSFARNLASDAPNTSRSCGRGPAGAAGRFHWKRKHHVERVNLRCGAACERILSPFCSRCGWSRKIVVFTSFTCQPVSCFCAFTLKKTHIFITVTGISVAVKIFVTVSQFNLADMLLH